jgi:transposase
MVVSWKLSEEQLRALYALLESTNNRRIVRNAMLIILSSQGRSKERVAEELGCSLGTVTNVRREYRLRGLAGLKPLPRPGRRSRATPQFLAALRATARNAPNNFGYTFRAWSAPRLALHLERETGLRFGEDQIRRFMRREGVPPRPYRTANQLVPRPSAAVMLRGGAFDRSAPPGFAARGTVHRAR